MADTDFGALQAAVVKRWMLEFWVAGRDKMFWYANGFIGKAGDMTSVIQRVTELTTTQRGKECVMQLILDMVQDGVVGDNKLDDNEELLINDAVTIRIDQLRSGVKSKGAMAEQATVIKFRQQAKDKLSFWIADKQDELMFLVMSGRAFTLKLDGTTRTASQLPSLSFAADVVAPSSQRIIYGGTATSEATLTTADKMSWAVIVRARTLAQRKRLQPINSKGKGHYCIVMSGEQERDLDLDPTYQTIVSRAGKQGDDNPLFTGAKAVVGGVIIYSHEKVFNTLGLASGSKWGSGSTVDGAQALMLGGGAGGIAWVNTPQWVESDKTDYQNRPGIGVGRMFGMLKPQFLSNYDLTAGAPTRQDFGVISIKTAAGAAS